MCIILYYFLWHFDVCVFLIRTFRYWVIVLFMFVFPTGKNKYFLVLVSHKKSLIRCLLPKVFPLINFYTRLAISYTTNKLKGILNYLIFILYTRAYENWGGGEILRYYFHYLLHPYHLLSSVINSSKILAKVDSNATGV